MNQMFVEMIIAIKKNSNEEKVCTKIHKIISEFRRREIGKEKN